MSSGKNIRSFARTWFDQHVESPNGKIYSSKFFSPDESWTKNKAWWFQLRVTDVEDMVKKDQNFYLLCQREDDSDSFYCLKVPATFIHLNRNTINKAKDQNGNPFYNIMLCACAENMFRDAYAPNGIDLSEYLVNLS